MIKNVLESEHTQSTDLERDTQLMDEEYHFLPAVHGEKNRKVPSNILIHYHNDPPKSILKSTKNCKFSWKVVIFEEEDSNQSFLSHVL